MRRIAFMFLLFCVAVTTPARAEWVDVDEDVAYERDSVTYDPADDVLAVYLSVFIQGEYWVYLRCREIAWRGGAGGWDAVLPDYLYPLRDTICTQRDTLPFQDF